MTLTHAIHLAVPVFAAHPQSDDYTLRDALVKAGVPRAVVADLIEFLPLAVARAMLDGMGVQFEEYYVRQDSQGKEVARKMLADEPVYREGLSVAGELSGVGEEAFLAIVGRSAEYRAISKALNAGRQAEDLALGPPVLIAADEDTGGKTWWKFWK